MGDEVFCNVMSGVEKQIIKKGKLGRRPSMGWSCGITVSREKENIKENLEITIGHGCSRKDRFFEHCIESMHLEEESLFTIQVDKDSAIHKVIIALKTFKEKPYIFQWTDAEKMDAANFYKMRGTELFRKNKFEEAFYKFSVALKFILLLDLVLEEDEPGLDVNNLRTALYNNLAGCHLHFKNYLSVVKLCNDSISVNPTAKALYRRSVAYIELREYDKAENDLTELLKLEPKNKAAFEKYKLVRELDRTNRENYESIVKRMFC